MTKLRNINAVKQLLSGNHKSQTKKTFSFDVSEIKKQREVGEIWTEKDAAGNEVTWEQCKGYKIQHGNFDELRKELDQLSCPSCSNSLSKRLDKKMMSIHKMCFDCVVKMEHELRLDGKWEEYEKSKVKENILAWLKEAEVEKNELVFLFRNPTQFINQDGSLEKWSQVGDTEEIISKIESDFEKLKEDLLSKV
jgi:hypothetical protein